MFFCTCQEIFDKKFDPHSIKRSDILRVGVTSSSQDLLDTLKVLIGLNIDKSATVCSYLSICYLTIRYYV